MGLFFDDTPDYKNPIVCIYNKGLLEQEYLWIQIQELCILAIILLMEWD